jgi:hypothetical protein
MPAFIFTFGSNHVHPVTGDSLGRRFVKIEAEDSEAARAEMVSRWGTRWAMQYAAPYPGIEKYELRELSRENPL